MSYLCAVSGCTDTVHGYVAIWFLSKVPPAYMIDRLLSFIVPLSAVAIMAVVFWMLATAIIIVLKTLIADGVARLIRVVKEQEKTK